MALRFNRSVKSAYLDRVVQKLSLEVAKDKFNPDVSLTVGPTQIESTARTYDTTGTTRTASRAIASGLSVTKIIQTGGNFTFSWARTDQLAKISGSESMASDSSTWTVQFTQPLLKGGGIDVNTASVNLAEMAEQSNLLSLKNNITSTVNSVITAFRSYAQTNRQVEIIKTSVERAKELLETNKFLIAVGRMAANEIIQTESDVANREFSYETALNGLDSARLTLLKVMDMNKHTMIIPLEEEDLTTVPPDFQTCLDIAFKNRSDYQNALISVDMAKIALMQAENNSLWELGLTSTYSFSDTNNNSNLDSNIDQWSVGLLLSVPLYGDLTQNQALVSARISLQKTKLSLEETTQNIEIEIQDALREVETKFKQMGMAKRARELSEKKLDVENEKLKVGRSSNFQLVSFQNELVNSLNEELNANIAYRNTLTSLDSVLGTTLDTWQIQYDKDYNKWPGK